MADIDGSFEVDTSKSQKSFKDLNRELKSVLSNLNNLTNKFGDLDKIDLKNITKQISALSSVKINVNTANANNSKIIAEASQIRAEGKVRSAEANVLNQEAKLIQQQAANYGQELVNMTTKVTAYASAISKQVDAATRKAHMQADTELKNATAEMKRMQLQTMRERSQYTGGFYGASAYTLSGLGMRMRNQHGAAGLAARFGQRLGEDQTTWFGRTFGKGGRINNAFGGLLAKGTVDGLGINAGSAALGGFISIITAAGKAVNQFAKSSIAAYGQMEKLAVNMEVVYGSKTQSNEAFSRIQEYATRSPFGVAQTTEMAVLLKQSGVYASELQSTLEMIGDVSAGNEEKMKRIANNYAQIQAIGKASMLDMRQFAYAGLPIYEEVAKNLQVSQKELRRMIGDGEVTAEIIEQAFKNMTGEGGMFYKSVNKGAATMAARQINLEDIKNIALSEWGKGFWNAGPQDSSLAQSFMQFKESLWESIGNIGKHWNIEQDFEKALNNTKYLKSLEVAYKTALANNNAPQAEALRKAMQTANANGINEDTISSAFVNKLMEEQKLNGLDVVSEQEYQKLEELMREIANNFGTAGAFTEEGFINKKFDRDYMYENMYDFEDQAMRETFDQIVEELRNSISESRLTDYMIKLSRSAEDADKALYWLQKNLNETANTTANAMNKIAKGSSSLSSLTEMYKERWRSSTEGKQEQAIRERRSYDDYKVRFEKMQGIYDYKNQRIDTTKRLTKNDLQEFYTSGFVTASAINFSKTEMGRDPYNKTWKDIDNNIKNAITLLSKENVIENEEQKKILTSLITLSKNIYSPYVPKTGLAFSGQQGADDLERSLEQIKSMAFNQGSDLIKSIVTGILNNYEAETDVAKYAEDAGAKLFIPLWKRVIAGATGWDVNSINSQTGFMSNYREFATKQIATGGIQGLASSGMSAYKLGTLIGYQSNYNAQGVKQVDWLNTITNIYNYATTLESSTKESANALQGLASSIQNQISVYERLTGDINAVGEDWSTINSVIKGEFSNKSSGSYTWRNQLDNAFAAAGNNDLFSLGADEKQGIIIRNKITGEVIGSLDELSQNIEENSAELNNFIKELNISNIIKPLDTAANEMRNLNNVISISDSIAQKTYALEQQVRQQRAKTWGSSYGAMGAIGGSKLNSDARQILNEFLSDFASSIAVLSITSSDKEIASAYKDITGSKEELDTSRIEAIRAAIDSYNKADYLGQAEAMKTLIQAFGGEMSRLINQAEEAANSIDESKYHEAASNLLSGPHSFAEGLLGTQAQRNGNSWFQQSILDEMGMSNGSFKSLSQAITEQALANPESDLYAKYEKKAGGEAELNEKIKEYKEAKEAYEDAVAGENTEEANAQLQKTKDILDEIGLSINQASLASSTFAKRLASLGNEIGKIFEQFMNQAVSSTFETWGEAIGKGADASKELQQNFTKLGAGLMSNLGTMITEAGLSMAIHASSMGEVLAGLGLAAVGGAASWLGGYLGADKEDKDKDDKEAEKLANLKNDLASLLEQARKDALYYENNLRHKTALGINASFSHQSVNDAIITPSGKVVTTDPKDYLIATKTPNQLVGGNAPVNVTPVINCNVVNNTSAKVSQQQRQNADGSIEIITMIEEAVGEYIASPRSDTAFESREYRLSSKQAVM